MIAAPEQNRQPRKDREMLKTVAVSANRKTGPIAVTYRSGEHEDLWHVSDIMQNCTRKVRPAQCWLTLSIWPLLLTRCPRGGMAWTYSHFAAEALPAPAPGKTVF
jgi:hypothetical protein